MTKYLRVDETGAVTELSVSSLEDLQTAVGGYITGAWEGKSLPAGTTVFANDEGLLLDMRPNLVASMVVGHVLVGPVLFGGPADYEGDVTDITKRAEELIYAMSLAVSGPHTSQNS